ncbi:MAG TPA: hypothetical protein VN698_07630 [Bacteroidia bacterium]|nr:hypothetical protein [Bacteroidia bacterium]
MKTIYTLLLLPFFVFAQKKPAQIITSGVFITKEDFKNNRLTEETDCQNDKETFKKHDFFSKAEFTVTHKGKKKTYLKKDIYAYRDCENVVWRFYQNKEYEIMETNNIYIYAIRKLVVNGETIERDPVYYFSKGPLGDIKKLSVPNLKLEFANNQTFHNLLDAEFKAPNVVEMYDAAHKTYEVNYLYKQAIK